MPRRLDPWILALLGALGLLPLVPFAVPVVTSLALAAASLPLQARLERRLPPWAAAALVTLGWTALAVIPIVAIAALLAPVVPALHQASLNPDALVAAAVRAPLIGSFAGGHQDAIRAWISQHQPETLFSQHFAEMRALGAHLLRVLVDAGLALALLWAVLTSRRAIGSALQSSLRRLVSIPLADRIESHVLRSTQSVIIGMLGLAIWDLVLTLPLFALAGLPSWAAWSVAVGMLSVLPGGTGLALVLATALLGAGGHVPAALAVLALGHVVTITGDFIVKPKIIGAASHAPFLLVLLAIFGGVAMFGLTGLILGPVLVLTAQAVVVD